MTIRYEDPVNKGNGWWFRRVSEAYEVWFGPYPSEINCYENLERLRKDSILSPSKGISADKQNLFENPGWRSIVQDIFGQTSTDAFPGG